MGTKAAFLETVRSAVERFPDNRMCGLVDAGQLQMEHYHAILLMIFHQTFHGPSTFALAAGHCDPRHHEARDYLMHHADEEKTHWRWVLGDLENTGYDGPDPRSLFPRPACQSYIAFNVYAAQKFPLGRLAIAAVLESIGASYGRRYSEKLAQRLELRPNQVVFFRGHGDTDVGHTQELLEVIDRCALSEFDWDWMCHAAHMAGRLYTAMYNEAVTG